MNSIYTELNLDDSGVYDAYLYARGSQYERSNMRIEISDNETSDTYTLVDLKANARDAHHYRHKCMQLEDKIRELEKSIEDIYNNEKHKSNNLSLLLEDKTAELKFYKEKCFLELEKNNMVLKERLAQENRMQKLQIKIKKVQTENRKIKSNGSLLVGEWK